MLSRCPTFTAGTKKTQQPEWMGLSVKWILSVDKKVEMLLSAKITIIIIEW